MYSIRLVLVLSVFCASFKIYIKYTLLYSDFTQKSEQKMTVKAPAYN